MSERSVFKERALACTNCGEKIKILLWDYDALPLCTCGGQLEHHQGPSNKAPVVIGDEIDVVVRDGVCWEDGTPRRFRSREELKREEIRRGVSQVGDTPHEPSKWF